MSVYQASDRSSIERLISRLDVCTKSLGSDSAERAHALNYAAFLTDLAAGRLDASDDDVDDMVQIVVSFCELVETEAAGSNHNEG